MGDIPLDFDTLQPYGCFIGSAAVIILSQHDKARDAALNLMRFFEHESCGQCTPCRVGTAKAAKPDGSAEVDQALPRGADVAMADASICGLGQAAPNPIRCVGEALSGRGLIDEDERAAGRRRDHRVQAERRTTVSAFAGETIIQAASAYGVDIPHLCYKEGYRPDGNCRACVVEIKGERVLAPSCCRQPAKGMEVSSNNERAVHSQKLVIELLMSDVPKEDLKPGANELFHWAGELGVTHPRFPMRHQPTDDISHPAMTVNLDACIQCTRCVRACREEQVNDVIGYAFRGHDSKIVFDMDDPMGESTCVACGECVQACPTGALAPAKNAYQVIADKKVDSVCPYCGVGCQLTYHVKDNKIVRVEGRDGPSNHERLCVKGRFGFDYVQHPQRLTTPLIRKKGAPKTGDFTVDPTRWRDVFREATWEEALDLAANGLKKVRDRDGPDALAGFGSAKGSNEEAYLFQKLVRTGFGTNNVDHCTRLCHASSVVALLEGIGSGRRVEPGLGCRLRRR
jgi:formate dehydrogenase major subunit